MGSSREMFIAGLAEPVALLALFAVALAHGTTSLATISVAPIFRISTLVSAAALFVVTVAETSRVPVDNQETHLELTMVHEAMVLEYSGRSLALIDLASHVKQMVFFSLIVAVVLPVGGIEGMTHLPVAIFAYAVKILCIACVVAVLEVSVAKMRLFRVADLLAFAAAVAGLAVVLAAGGL
jgi:formate hydrogenlyase subunit 4